MKWNFFDTTDYDKGAALIEEKYHIPLVLITMGKDGSRAYYRGRKVEAAPFLQEKPLKPPVQETPSVQAP